MNSAIIVAGGSGSRMKSKIPKQFLLLAKKPFLFYSLEAFALFDPDIQLVLVLPETFFLRWEEIVEQYNCSIPHTVMAGGETRFQSVKNGLEALNQDGLVAIHDGARPLLSQTLISRTFDTATTFGNAIPVVPVSESMRILEEAESRPIDRAHYRLVQTPQVFRIPLIKKAYQQDFDSGFTDDATVIEAMGETVHLVDGDTINIKITHPSDLAQAEFLVNHIPNVD